MIAIRQRVKPVNHIITIDLPKNFNSDEVEVIVLPVDKKEEKKTIIRRPGLMKGKMTIKPSFYEPLEEFEEYE
jgi:hypothetical protein